MEDLERRSAVIHSELSILKVEEVGSSTVGRWEGVYNARCVETSGSRCAVNKHSMNVRSQTVNTGELARRARHAASSVIT
jgi:hypothetical protein